MSQGMVLFMGMVRRGECEGLQRRHVPVGVLADTNSRHRLADVSGFALVESFDFSRPRAELVEKVRSIQAQRPLACLFNVGEFYVAQTARVAAALGMNALAPASARLCLDKRLMRTRFQERIGPDATARFHVVTSESDLLYFADQLGYPVFLQPANVAASMWVTCNPDPDTLRRHYRALLHEVPAYYAKLGKPDLSLTVVVAEYLHGDNTSIDCLIDRAGHVTTTPVVDVLTGRDIGIDDFHHFARLVPTRLGPTEQEELSARAVAGVQALDMTTSMAHVEFIGTRLGEIGARPGGNRPRLLELAYGMDTLHAYYRILCGQDPDFPTKHNRGAAIVTPFPAQAGTLRKIRHLDRLTRLPGYLYHEVRIEPGQSVGLAQDGYRAPLYIELVSPDANAIRASVDRIAAWTDLFEVD